MREIAAIEKQNDKFNPTATIINEKISMRITYRF
jgi:hypothetical protein